jgi:hypothetical protein
MYDELLCGAQHAHGRGCAKWKEGWVPFNVDNRQ